MSSTVRLRRLSQELVRLRNEAGLTVEEVTKLLDWSSGRLTNMEKNKWVRPDLGNIIRLLDLYRVTGPMRDYVIDLVRQSREKGWWAAYKDIFPASYPGFEAAASCIRTFEALLVPGLLQTEDYTAAIVRASQVLDPVEVTRRVKARRARQGILERDNPPQFWAVIDEAALVKQVGGPAVMEAQIRHLMDMALLPHVTIQVQANESGAHSAMMGSFVILDFPSDKDASLVYLEGITSSLYMEKPGDVQEYTLTFGQLLTSALPPEKTMSHLAALAAHYNEVREHGSNHP